MSDKKRRACVFLRYEYDEEEKSVTSFKWWFVYRDARTESVLEYRSLGHCVRAAKGWCARNGYEFELYG
jgi:hypothetical protein